MTEKKSKKGFASMSKEKQLEIAKMGGKAAHALGRAHEFTSEEGKAAGMKGGLALVISKGSKHMAEIGRKGGQARAKKAARAAQGPAHAPGKE